MTPFIDHRYAAHSGPAAVTSLFPCANRMVQVAWLESGTVGEARATTRWPVSLRYG